MGPCVRRGDGYLLRLRARRHRAHRIALAQQCAGARHHDVALGLAPEVISTWPADISPVSTRRVSTRARRTTCTTVPAEP